MYLWEMLQKLFYFVLFYLASIVFMNLAFFVLLLKRYVYVLILSYLMEIFFYEMLSFQDVLKLYVYGFSYSKSSIGLTK